MRSLDGTYTRLLRKALNVSYAQHVRNVDLYGSIPRQHRLLFNEDLVLLVIASDVPTNRSMISCSGSLEQGTNAFVASIMKDTGFSKEELGKAMLDRDQ
jgi:hypothetical protein